MKTYYTNKCFRLENGKVIDEVKSDPYSSNPTEAYVEVYLKSEVDLEADTDFKKFQEKFDAIIEKYKKEIERILNK